jgi:hypothetical protein
MLEYLKKSEKDNKTGQEGIISGLKYSQLVELLGEPKKYTKEDNRKVDVEWNVENERGYSFRVWNYKNGPNYLNGGEDEEKVEKALASGELTKEAMDEAADDKNSIWSEENQMWENQTYWKLMEPYEIKITLEDIDEWSVGFNSDSVYDRSLAKMVFGDKLRVGFPVMSNGGRIVIMSEIH